MIVGYQTITKLLLVSFDAEFGKHRKEILKLCQDVQDEASLASKQAQVEEHKLQDLERFEASKSRKLLARLNESLREKYLEDEKARMDIQRRRSRRQKLESLDRLSRYNHEKTYRQTRSQCSPGTSTWMLGKQEYLTWKSGGSGILWCHGKCKNHCCFPKKK